MQVSLCLVGWHQQREQQVDRLIVDRVEGDGGFQLDKNADSTQRILFQFTVREWQYHCQSRYCPFFRG